MSVKAIAEALDLLAEDPAESYATLLAARAELEALVATARAATESDVVRRLTGGGAGPEMARLSLLLEAIAKDTP